MKKITARAHSNIAFVKYWGRKNEELRLPTNGSISMNLSGLHTTTTVIFDPTLNADIVTINGQIDDQQNARVSRHLDRIRKMAGTEHRARVASINNFPTGTGLSSSASGFAALTVAAAKAAGLTLSEKELSILARQGSGSACRSIPRGFVEWTDADTSEDSFAHSLFPETYWDIRDIVAVVSKSKKDVPTSEGQMRVQSSIFFETRLDKINRKIALCKQLLAEKKFDAFGTLTEMEALEMHAVMLTSWPSLIYWLPQTITVMKSVQQWRKEGLPVYFTVNTGQDIHVLCERQDEEEVVKRLSSIEGVTQTIRNQPSQGAYEMETHLV